MIEKRIDKDSEAYFYEKYIKELSPKLLEYNPLRIFKKFCQTLKKAIEVERDTSTDIEDDLSYYWRKVIDENKGYSYHKDFRNVLVNAIRDSLIYIGNERKNLLNDAFNILRIYKFSIFRRLELYAIRFFPELTKEYLQEYLLNQLYFKKIDEFIEYYLALKELYPKLKKKERAKYEEWVEDGPNIERFKSTYKEVYNKDPTDEKIDNHILFWRASKIAPIYNYISKNLLNDYKISQKHIDKVDPFRGGFTGIQIGSISPVSIDDFKKMPIPKIIQFLIEYEEPEHSFTFSRDGLGRSLRETVSERADEFLEIISKFLEVKQLYFYLSYLIDGFKEAIIEKKIIFELEPVFSFCIDILHKGSHLFNQGSMLSKEETFRNIKISIGWFIEEILRKKDFSLDYKEVILDLIRILLKDEEPTLEYESKNIQSNWSLEWIAFNTVRGIAMNSIINYALWYWRNLSDQKKKDTSVFKLIPEIKEILEDHLKIDIEPAYSIRFIYGMHLNNLIYLNRNWVEENLNIILPLEKDKQRFWEAAWSGFLKFNNVHMITFDILKDHYIHSLNYLKKDGLKVKLIHFPDDRYTIHLIVLYINGIFDLESENSLIVKFFNIVSDDVRRIAINYIGRYLENISKDENFKEILERLKKLWEYRLEKANIESKNFKKELGSFLYWFNSSIFGRGWIISKINETINLLDGNIGVHYDIVKKFLEFTDDYPIITIECLEKIIRSKIETEGFLLYEDKFKAIFEKILQINNEEAKIKVKNIIHYLGSKDIHHFRQLLNLKK